MTIAAVECWLHPARFSMSSMKALRQWSAISFRIRKLHLDARAET
jgi:hypothetical protein